MGDPIIVDKGEAKSGSFLAVLKKDQLFSSNTKLTFGVFSDGEKIEEYSVTFIGPNSLDKKK